MREIKFRGKYWDSGKWCYGSYVVVDNLGVHRFFDHIHIIDTKYSRKEE